VRAASPAFSVLDAGSDASELAYQASRRDPLGNGSLVGGVPDSVYYRDGRYCAAHMYGFTKNYKGMNQVVRVFADKTVGGDDVGGVKTGPQTFDLGTNTVLPDGAQTIARNTLEVLPASGFGCCDYDPRNGDIYMSGNGNPAAKYTRSTNSWASFGDPCNWGNIGSWIDTIRNRRFYLFGIRPWFGENVFRLNVQDLATGVIAPTIALPDISNSNIYTTHSGLNKPIGYEHDVCVHDVDRDLYLYFMSGTFGESGGDKTHIFSVLPDPPYTVTWLQAIPVGSSPMTGSPYYWQELGLITFFVGNFDQHLYGIRTR
jgi:hypothetical protein